MSTYKEHLTAAMTQLAQDERVCFVGYNVKYGRAAGTLKDVNGAQLYEMPLAENLMMGAAIGMSLDGRIPVVYLERFDFILCCLDAICNHLDKLNELSEGVHRPACIIRCVVGNSVSPLFTGATHTQDFSMAMREMVSFPVRRLPVKEWIGPAYAEAYSNALAGISTMLVDYKDSHEL